MEEYINNILSSSSWVDGDSKEGQNCNHKPSILNGCLKIGNVGLQYGSAIPALGSVDLSYPKQLQVVDEVGIDVGYSYNSSAIQNLSSIPQLWPLASYDSVSSVSAVMGQDKMQQFSLHGGSLEDETDFMEKRYVCMDQILQLDKLSEAVTTKDKKDMQSYPASAFAAGPNTTMASNGVSFLSQTTSTAPAVECNGTGKPRVRARRGQATDPHSIAERLRREKIAERMKNLQELVPNSTKIDKASMLDEIIEYVKFLQLQVKVLSMSRLGAAGAVIPLITDGQAEGSRSLSLSPSAGLGLEVSPSPDQIAFEQEVLNLLESNVTTAIQYLQSKGLCLMPIALASAISSGKASLSCGIACGEKKSSFTNASANSNRSDSPSSNCSKSTIANGCDGIVKQEKAFCRELKPNTLH
ncbi:hypothetical protein JCGZ_07540 [Jatropha curcas]|uniref:BHLH domain-containing protein n=1 Tax=Jatropha curcas TaxID=180498 RepID=A0A067KQ64_JATCU|nr:uncharacterized protein LOC105638024 [Jatropha curcas]XP_012077121.1 uncharacterized protein LOC105638024 [Jatropha curcas]XP_012077122.1 uncharacterized protein LOC105638024 [Jatropha curcas]KDP33969.1 hypothetical protein JCGZ_07540 [Jatropha curcas]